MQFASIDNDVWHFISAAYDGSGTVRFTIDGQAEQIPCVISRLPANDGIRRDITIAAKTNASGTVTRFFDGEIDEPRLSNAFVPTTSLLSAWPNPWISAQTIQGTTPSNYGCSGIALDGATAVVGAYGSKTTDSGNAYVYTVGPTGEMSLQATLAPDDNAQDFFGTSVAISGNTILVGSPQSNVTGRVYVFDRIGTSWLKTAVLSADDLTGGAAFGSRVTVLGDVAVIGAPALNTSAGAAYVFTRNQGTWSRAQRLTGQGSEDTYFGTANAIGADGTLVIGEPGYFVHGNAYVYVRSGATWVQQQQLSAPDARFDDAFGSSVALLGDKILIGADGARNLRGAAYLFTRAGAAWSLQQELFDQDGTTYSAFGSGVALTNDQLFVGNGAFASGNGTVHVYGQSGNAWLEQQALYPPDLPSGHGFGYPFGLSGKRLVVGQGDFDYGKVWFFSHGAPEGVPNPVPAAPRAVWLILGAALTLFGAQLARRFRIT